MNNAKQDYDDDVFTLKDDGAHKRRAHLIQYVLISTFAVVVLSVALYMSYYLTETRLRYQNRIVGDEQQSEGAEPAEQVRDPNYWPRDMFPELPVIEAPLYDTRIDPERSGKVEVNVPMATASRFSEYADKLAADGAVTYVKTQRLTVLSYKDIEIHLLYSGTKNAAVLCSEPKVDFNEPDYQQFPRPETGKLVEVSAGAGEGNRVLTYRLASAQDASNYCAQLMKSGWTLSGTLEPQDQIFSCSFKKEGAEGQPGLQISVDYFSAGDNYRVRFDYIQLAAPAA